MAINVKVGESRHESRAGSGVTRGLYSLLVLLVFLIAGCGGGGSGQAVTADNGTQPPATSGGTKLKPDVVELAPGVLINVDTSASKATLAAAAPGVNPGNVLLSSEGDGYLARVTDVDRSRSNGEVVVTTQPAGLDEAFESLQASVSKSLSASEWTFADVAEGITIEASEPSRGINVPVVKFNNLTIGDGVQLSGAVRLDLSCVYDLDYRLMGLRKFEFVPTVGLEGALRLKAERNASVRFEKLLARGSANLTALTKVPAVLEMRLLTNAAASLKVGFDASASARLTTTFGVRFESGNWSTVGDTTPTLEMGLSGRPIARAEFAVTPVRLELSLKILGVAGPYCFADLPRLEGFADALDGNRAHLKSDAVVEATAGVRVQILTRTLADKQFPSFFTRRWTVVDRAKDFPPDNRAPLAENGNAETRKDTPVGITAVASDPDGNALSYRIVGGPTHGTLSGSGPSYQYTPHPGFVGNDSLSFRVSDGRLESNIAIIALTVVDPGPPAGTQVVVDDSQEVGAIDHFGFFKWGTPRNWVRRSGLGVGGSMLYTYNNDPQPLDNVGQWRPQLPGNGRYRIEAFIPRANAETFSARYEIWRAGAVVHVAVVNQNALYDVWTSLGDFDLWADGSHCVRLLDITGERTVKRKIGFDAVRWTKL